MTPSTNRPPLRRYLRHGMLPQLATFEAVLRFGSAGRAAEAMCIAQPTLCGHLRKLAEAVGVPLFRIQGKHLVPTEAASVLLRTCHEIFAALEHCETALAPRRPEEPVRRANAADATTTLAAVPATEPAGRAAVDRTPSANDPVFGRRHAGRQRRLAEAPAVAREPQDRTALGCACDTAVRYSKPHGPRRRPAQFMA